jgi:hypothetical protein
LRELFGAAYYPGLVREGEPASGERQAFVPGVFGNIFDVLVASETHKDAIDPYRAIIAGGEINWTAGWAKKLEEYLRNGGVVVLNSAQIRGLPMSLLGIRLKGENGEAHNAKCLLPNEPPTNLHGGIFRYQRVDLTAAQPLMTTTADQPDPLVTVNKIGRGKLIFVAVPDLLGEDERLPAFVAHLLVHLAVDATPVRVEGEVEYLVNRTSRGWVVTLFNDNGVFKPQQGLAQVDRSAIVTAKLSLRGSAIVNASEWVSDQGVAVNRRTGAHDSVSITIPAGGIAVVELQTNVR